MGWGCGSPNGATHCGLTPRRHSGGLAGQLCPELEICLKPASLQNRTQAKALPNPCFGIISSHINQLAAIAEGPFYMYSF